MKTAFLHQSFTANSDFVSIRWLTSEEEPFLPLEIVLTRWQTAEEGPFLNSYAVKTSKLDVTESQSEQDGRQVIHLALTGCHNLTDC